MTSETSDPFSPALIRLSLITILPRSDAFSEDKDPQYDPKKTNKFNYIVYKFYIYSIYYWNNIL